MRKLQTTAMSIILAGISTLVSAESFTIRSAELQNGEFNESNMLSEPYGFGCTGKNIAPSFSWSNAPAGTKSFVLTIYDRDAPTGIGWTHWIVANIPASVSSLSTGIDASGKNLPKGALQPRTDFGVSGYGGPCPPKGSTHNFEITLTALKVEALPHVSAESTPALVGYFTKANAIGEAKLTIAQRR
ncbi:YbhB/YbcL family Raf kinase inhibitor-like protein [Pseudomonas rustica]